MHYAAVRASALLALTAFLPVAAAATPKPFPGLSGWDHTVGATPSPQAARSQESWKKSDGELVTYLEDGGLAYDDTVSLIRKNITDNGLKPTVNADRTCDGRRAHEVEMTFGNSIVRQIVVDDGPGVTKLTYTHPQGSPPSAEVTSAITAYCGAPSK